VTPFVALHNTAYASLAAVRRHLGDYTGRLYLLGCCTFNGLDALRTRPPVGIDLTEVRCSDEGT